MAMHSAAASGNVDKIAAMRSYDAVNARNRFGWRPVHAAVYHGHARALDALIAAGADVALPAYTPTSDGDDGGRGEMSWTTALHLAAGRGDADMAQRLLEAGAERGRRDSAGRLAADVARLAGHRRLAEALAPDGEGECGAVPDYAAVFGQCDGSPLPCEEDSGRQSVG